MSTFKKTILEARDLDRINGAAFREKMLGSIPDGANEIVPVNGWIHADLKASSISREALGELLGPSRFYVADLIGN